MTDPALRVLILLPTLLRLEVERLFRFPCIRFYLRLLVRHPAIRASARSIASGNDEGKGGRHHADRSPPSSTDCIHRRPERQYGVRSIAARSSCSIRMTRPRPRNSLPQRGIA
jgi:hypothetical protein